MSVSNADMFCDDLAANRALERHGLRIPLPLKAASIKARHITPLVKGIQNKSGAITGLRFPDRSIASIIDGTWVVQP